MRILCQTHRACRGRRVLALGVVLAIMGCAGAAAAQHRGIISKDELGWIYARAQFAVEFEDFLVREGRLIAPAGMDRHAVPSDTLGPWILSLAAQTLPPPPEIPWAGEVHAWRVIAPDERLKYQARFRSTKMAYVGNDQFEYVDTTATPLLRAKLQSAFGPPTETIVEARFASKEVEYIQFEYWFVVNDSISTIVIDAHGPLDHGIVFAGDYRFRDFLFTMRSSLLGRALREASYGVYVDYFYDDSLDQWYRTGYDGSTFFTESIREPSLTRGRPALQR